MEVLQDGGRGEGSLQLEEGRFCRRGPQELGSLDSFAGKEGEWGCYFRVVGDELAIEVSKPQKLLHLLDRSGPGPVCDGREFCKIHADALSGHETPDERH